MAGEADTIVREVQQRLDRSVDSGHSQDRGAGVEL
jgi:hypothetical protein